MSKEAIVIGSGAAGLTAAVVGGHRIPWRMAFPLRFHVLTLPGRPWGDRRRSTSRPAGSSPTTW